ncbi:hypothetical protein EX30DRAFT_112249 [Ascodesmis nigricans]|uniref:Uncharacterized protein n=1 Tax=Ascodesmis nigricans TaxID=341454 RepID=A0A4S2MQ67_9PEZI|nr:hypothetical protein EX30DRAFT_112249 [Ascodesmis nigricans]
MKAIGMPIVNTLIQSPLQTIHYRLSELHSQQRASSSSHRYVNTCPRGKHSGGILPGSRHPDRSICRHPLRYHPIPFIMMIIVDIIMMLVMS